MNRKVIVALDVSSREEALHLVYVFVMRTLQEHRRQGRNGEYEAFALQLLAMLQKYRYLYTNPPEAPAPD